MALEWERTVFPNGIEDYNLWQSGNILAYVRREKAGGSYRLRIRRGGTFLIIGDIYDTLDEAKAVAEATVMLEQQ